MTPLEAGVLAWLGKAESDNELLSRFGASIRYPDPIYAPTEDDGREMAAAATRLFTTVLELLGA